MGADIFDSYVASAVAVMLLGFTLPQVSVRGQYTLFPLILCTLGIIASLIGLQFVHVGKKGKPGAALNRGTLITCGIFAAMLIPVVLIGEYDLSVFWAAIAGLITACSSASPRLLHQRGDKPVNETARVSGSGAAINIITGSAMA
jgi:K(+)-stimulated pyrophosphate-energized sodium pump